MELERVKAAWQREKSRYPLELDVKRVAADTRQQAMKMDRVYARQQILQIACGLLCLGMMAFCYDGRKPIAASAGFALMLLAMALMLAGIVSLTFRLRISHPEWPEKKYLVEQREKISGRIALVRRNRTWFFIPSLLGFLLWQIVLSPSIPMAAVMVILVALVVTGGIWWSRRMLRKDLLPLLEEIDQELRDLGKKPVSRAV
jgi:FtsH-binding integral membrane protein